MSIIIMILLTNQWQVERGMTDFHVIKYKGDRFSVEHYNQLHAQSIEFLIQALHLSNTHTQW